MLFGPVGQRARPIEPPDVPAAAAAPARGAAPGQLAAGALGGRSGPVAGRAAECAQFGGGGTATGSDARADCLSDKLDR
jgi:hypothetical protein